MKRKNLMKTALVGGLAMMLMSTTALSFAFWQSGISGSETTSGSTIGIGEGSNITTNLKATFARQGDTGERLIPLTRQATPGATTNEIHYRATVVWTAIYNLNKEMDEAKLALVEIDLDSANVGTTNFESRTSVATNPTAGWYANDKTSLFFIEKNHITNLETATLGTNTEGLETYTFTVDFVLRMNEPADRAEYDIVANNDYSFRFNFVINTDDLDINKPLQ